jgi:hypothetical protein
VLDDPRHVGFEQIAIGDQIARSALDLFEILLTT